MKLAGSVLLNEGKRRKDKGPLNLVREKYKHQISTMWSVSCLTPRQATMDGREEATFYFGWVDRKTSHCRGSRSRILKGIETSYLSRGRSVFWTRGGSHRLSISTEGSSWKKGQGQGHVKCGMPP